MRRSFSKAISARREGEAVAALVKLHGVAIPVASAILTMMRPSQYTVIDFLALETLGLKKTYISIDFYLDYLDACRYFAENVGVEAAYGR